MNAYNTSTLIDGCKLLNIDLSEAQIGQFVRFYEMLVEKNKVMNLTAITQWDDVVTKHFLDSLLICKAFDFKKAGPENGRSSLRLLDLGTGAGFPGIPLKITVPMLNITLADSLNKRIAFINDVISELKLEHIETVHARAEDLGRNAEFREQYDIVVSRAVANLSSLSEYCLPFVRQSGYFISYKSTDIDTEIKDAGNAIKILGGDIENIITLDLPGTDMKRSFVIIKKVHPAPLKYPRKAGVPSRSPL